MRFGVPLRNRMAGMEEVERLVWVELRHSVSNAAQQVGTLDGVCLTRRHNVGGT